MDNNDKTQSNDQTTKTDNKTVANKPGVTSSPTGGENKGAPQSSGKSGNQSASTAASSAATSGQAVSDTVSDATGAIKDALGQAKETGGAVASKAYGIAAEKATAAIDEQKTNLTAGLTSVADTIRQIGGNLSGAQEPTGVANIAAQYTNTAADKVEQISGYLERRDFKALVRDLEDVAHKNPAIFLGGAFALGILAARFFKSGSSSNAMTRRAENRSSESSSGNSYTTGGGVQVRQLRRKTNGKTDTLKASDDSSPNRTSDNTGG